ncbi:hypothetical protein [Lysobacter gummosus]|uniref:hypothetical protein n=1 Tax=Lysobacter gummosus TaxID=262324 RepID=UPI0036320214
MSSAARRRSAQLHQHAGGAGPQAELAQDPRSNGQGQQQAEYGYRRPRTDRLKEMPSLFRRRAAHSALEAGRLSPDDRAPGRASR